MTAIRLIYASDAADGLRYSDFMTLLTRAAEKNREYGITGMLCYGSGQFLQALEGQRYAVNALYHHIARDPRHVNCQLLSVEEIATRDFGEWLMKIVDWTDGISAAQRATLLDHAQTATFDPRSMHARQAVEFLQELAEMERMLLE